MAKLKYPGVPIYMNGQNYYIPSLSTKDFHENYEGLTAPPAEGSTAIDAFDRFIPIILLAINRNHPEVTLANLEDWLDLYTFPLAVKAVQSASGLTVVTEGE